ncbi:MAG TPA: hypothetical protein VHM26_00655 [Chitinophagaceae bacterium]|jgi:hypothetical protein|nr:hypothetical protein [Chitinophagaceae bacterium]
MKRIIIATIALAGIVAGCKKNEGYDDPSVQSTGAKVKFANLTFTGFSVIFYGKDTTVKFSGAAPATGNILTGVAYNNTFPVNDYAAIGAYTDSLKIRVPLNATTNAGLFKGITKLNIEDGKRYTVFLLDTLPNLDYVITEDHIRDLSTIIDTVYDVRFVHAIVGVGNVDIFSKNENRVVFANVPFKGAADFTTLRRNSVVAQDSIFIRNAGTPTIITRMGFTPTARRTYTWFGRGRSGSTTTAPAISFYTNQ